MLYIEDTCKYVVGKQGSERVGIWQPATPHVTQKTYIYNQYSEGFFYLGDFISTFRQDQLQAAADTYSSPREADCSELQKKRQINERHKSERANHTSSDDNVGAEVISLGNGVVNDLIVMFLPCTFLTL